MIATAPTQKYFRAAPIKAAPQRVDRKANVIRGAAIMQLGPVNDRRPWIVDDTTLSQLVELGSQPNKGIKARFTHPNMSQDGMGRHLGRWQNFRRDGDLVRADLHLAKAATEREYGKYVLDFAEEDPELFGNSVVIGIDDEAMESLEEDGDGRKGIRLWKLYATDVVDDPAATRGGFFSNENDPADIPGVVTNFLDTHFAGASPDAIRARFDGLLTRYFSAKGITMTAPAAPASVPAVDIDAKFSALEASVIGLIAKVNSIPAQIADAETQATARAASISALFTTHGLGQDEALGALLSDKTKTIADAREVVLSKLLSRQSGGAVNPGSGDAKPSDPDTGFKAEYAKDLEYFRKSGTTEEDYVASRRVTEGLDPLILPARKAG